MNRLAVLVFACSISLCAQAPKDLKAAISVFQAAVASNDVDRLASITKWPIKSNEFGSIRSKSELRKKYKLIFTPARCKGLVGQQPQPLLNKVYSLSSNDQSDPIQFLFKRFGDRFMFYSIDNVNE